MEAGLDSLSPKVGFAKAGNRKSTFPDHVKGRKMVRKRPIAAQRACEPVVDRFAKPFVRDRHDRDGFSIRAIERAQVREQIGGCLDQVAALRQVKRDLCVCGAVERRGPERQQRFAGFDRFASSRSGVCGA